VIHEFKSEANEGEICKLSQEYPELLTECRILTGTMFYRGSVAQTNPSGAKEIIVIVHGRRGPTLKLVKVIPLLRPKVSGRRDRTH